ncbi:glycoside hydrolase family 28 protein [Flavobacterium johnsoniae]|uniref:Candidate polygalacturonase Glycoside hydrolase family 28 n=1 Tax=Flavobacterium johnsoniae (strain ATCC 17061 / DSM 2064 / JCM 8514 / BCRC 14874 / CCUG 350202 / NBRC 14942 / NCIMB 11054 / UW101) TaxID=376686 RepID=A5FC09_FLAJ1|nr:glycoside hydrolase family 28 protein [Flavobacterium johnsoniae]ABQ07264.1 Candidate polygalacturonase; Glycoside hydrolase family 28 [Flavobacterium johnsoniae UW101]OXE95627.1 glycoside hydrolase [Flavobacterium johnsoniae UW101]WQG80900.1 glycoside hydrolase family 28 protein [Flavobacterium johnsoniae UW101]SHL18133.1 Polygalacturonase [Flavobacterium johnsoniae]
MITNKVIALKSVVFLSITVILTISCSKKITPEAETDPWKTMELTIKNLPKTNFQDKTYNINDFGAVADGKTLNTAAFEKAIQTCTENGGGKVLVPNGKYLTGAIHLENNVNLHLEDKAEILFSLNPKDYPIVHTSWEGTELMNYSPLIYAKNKTNVAITGKGILNGQADSTNWWIWSGAKMYGWKKGIPSQNDPTNREVLVDMAEKDIPVEQRIFGEGRYLRPNFIEFFECNTVLVKDITVINSPFWILHPIKTNNMIIDGVTVNSHGPNNDGCDPEYSQNIVIKNCTFNTGDDCIAIKAGRDADGRRVAIPSKNIIVQNCKMIDGHGGVVIGSEISAGVNNVFVENCVMDSPNLDRAIRIKTNSRRGGIIENVFVRNLEVGTVKECVLKLNMFYNVYGSQTGNFIPVIRNINLENVNVKNGGKYSIWAEGYKESPVENITLKNVKIQKVDSIYLLKNVKNINFINTYINEKKVE